MKIEIIISIATSIIAITAVAVAVWQGVLTRRHNKLSVRPILNFKIGSSKALDFVGIRLVNDGFGPAIVESINLFIGNEFVGKSKYDVWVTILRKLNISKSPFLFNSISEKHPISSGQSLNLIYLDSARITEQDIQHFKLLKKMLKVSVNYKSIYEEPFFLEMKK